MMPILQIGPAAVPVPALVILAGIWAGLSVAEKHAPRSGINASHLYNLAFAALVAGLVGARLTYAIRYPSVFFASPLSLISRDLGLLDPWGGAAVGLITALVYGQRKKMPFWPTLDALTPGLAVFAVALGLSHLASGAAFGTPTNLPWGIELWGARRQPTQIYEILAGLLVLWAVYPGAGLVRSRVPGVRFLVFIALSALARLFLEAFRGDSTLLLAGIRTVQVIAWVVLAASLVALGRLRNSQAAAQAIGEQPVDITPDQPGSQATGDQTGE